LLNLLGCLDRPTAGQYFLFAQEVLPRGGSIEAANSIHPGVIETPMLREVIAAEPDPEAARAEWMKGEPIGRFGTAEDIAYGALYLASDESSFVTGAELVIDGGWTAQ